MRLVFISTMSGYPWGGSEELWSQSAARLRAAGHTVAASFEKTTPVSPKLQALAAQGIELRLRAPARGALSRAIWARLSGRPIKDAEQAWLRAQTPDLVVISMGGISDGWHWMKFCREAALPYAAIVQSNADAVWVRDDTAAKMAAVYDGARAVYCVSQHNLRRLEWQLGQELPKACVVWNPNNAGALEILPWPEKKPTTRLACVARLEPEAKGQDILFQVLAQPLWRNRPIELNLYGAGPCEQILRKMAARLHLANVVFRGHIAKVDDIWRDNHLLVLPSRHEGMPLTLIEAMSCGRPAVVTDVGGNAELCVDGETGFVASAPAVGPFAEALERAWARGTEWENMGRAARERVLQIVPRDSVGEFCEALLALAESARK